MKDEGENIQERQLISESQAVQKKLDKANKTLRPFTREQISEAFAKSRVKQNV